MRYILFALLIVVSTIPLTAQAAPVDFFGPILPEICRNCPTAPGWGCVLQTVQNLIRLAITLGIVFATLAIAYAGFTWMTSGNNPGRREQGRTLLINVFIGLFVMLSAWLIVDFVMKTLYDDAKGGFGPWNSILAGVGGDECLVMTVPTPITSGTVDIVFVGTGDSSGGAITPTTDPLPGADGSFTFQSGIQSQMAHASPALRSLLSCMADRVPANVGQISSISDSFIVNRQKTFQECAQGGCQHSANSCHYGGRQCIGSSYAVDFGDEYNANALISAAKGCGALNAGIHNSNHVHVTVRNNCGCQ